MYGGLGIVVGLATWGHRVIATLGKQLVPLTFSKGYCAQFGAVSSVLAATALGLPISTTSVLVGAISGTGLAEGKANVNGKLLARIALGWITTLPAAGAVAALSFAIVRALQ